MKLSAWALFVAAVILGSAQAQLVLEREGSLQPGMSTILEDEINISDTNAAVNVTVTGLACDRSGNSCSAVGENGFPAQLELYCGNAKYPSSSFLVSDYLGATQTILYTPLSPMSVNETEDTVIRCIITAPYVNSGPVSYTLSAEEVETLPTLSEEEQASLGATYEQCCASEDACMHWKEVNVASGEDVFVDFCKMGGNFGLDCDVTGLNFANMSLLEHLVLSKNSLTGNVEDLFQELQNVTSLKDIIIDSNPNLGGALEESILLETGICSLVENGLKYFAFGDTNINGTLPSCLFGGNSTLQDLTGSLSAISGEIPDSITDAQSLRTLQISGANLTGTVPVLPISIVTFNVSRNSLSGEIPIAPENMVIIDISYNNFTGIISDEYHDHPSLRAVDFVSNGISGLPTSWEETDGKLTNDPPLEYLYLSENPLSASVFPAGLGQYESLQGFWCTRCQLAGPLPEVPEGSFPSLLRLFIDVNDVNGTVPDSWESINLFAKNSSSNEVRIGNFSNNMMSGELPDFVGYPLLNAFFDFSGNDFTNGCEAQFSELNACTEAISPSAAPALIPGETVTGEPDIAPATSPSPGTDAPAVSPEPAAPSDDSEEEDSGGGGLSGGAIAGIVIVVVFLAGVGGYFGYKKWKNKQTMGSFEKFADQDIQLTSTNQSTYNPNLEP
eukprot:jgi/Picsp_1/6765/NSC_04106-R1_rni-like protein